MSFELRSLCSQQRIPSFQSMRGSCDTLESLKAYCPRTCSRFKYMACFVLKIDLFHLNFCQDDTISDLILIIKVRFNFLTESAIFLAKVLLMIPNFIHH